MLPREVADEAFELLNLPEQERLLQSIGQAEALEKALEQEPDCAAVLQQIAAIRGAVE